MELGRFGKLHVRVGKGARGSGPRERMVPLINGADATLRWFVADVWGHFDDDHTRPGAPLFPSERRNTDGTCRQVGDDALRAGLAEATTAHLPEPWQPGPARSYARLLSVLPGPNDDDLHDDLLDAQIAAWMLCTRMPMDDQFLCNAHFDVGAGALERYRRCGAPEDLDLAINEFRMSAALAKLCPTKSV